MSIMYVIWVIEVCDGWLFCVGFVDEIGKLAVCSPDLHGQVILPLHCYSPSVKVGPTSVSIRQFALHDL